MSKGNDERGKKGKEESLERSLSDRDRRRIEDRIAIGAKVVHEAIRNEGQEELARPSSALAWSGLAAGLSMGFSLLAEGLLSAHLPDAPWAPLISRFGYSLGFLIVVLGRQQLFTENTLTVILPLLTRRDLPCVWGVLRLWSIVLAANLVGVFFFAWALGGTDLFQPYVKQAFARLGMLEISYGFWLVLLKGIFAGWLIALMVWLLPFAEAARVHIIIIVTYLVGLAEFSHVIAGSSKVLYLVATGEASPLRFLYGYMVPSLVGNTIGGVSLVAVVNHAQVVAGGEK